MNELAQVEQLPVVHVATPMTLIQMAVSQGQSVDQLQKLFELQLRWEANEARKAYHVAFSAFKSEAIAIIKRTPVNDGPLKGKKYADLSAVVDAVTPMLSKYELASSWKVTKDEPAWIEITCTLTHVLGHSESTAMGGAPDTGGAKNFIQARASTVNYLERYSLKAVCGLSEKGADDDGRQGKTGMDEKAKADWLATIEAHADPEKTDDLWKRIAEATTAAKDVVTHDELRAALNAQVKKIKALKTKEVSL